MDVLNKVPVREQDAKTRATNFEEVCLGYNMEEAMAEASRCINCKNAQCVKGCPVSIDIPGFVEKVKENKIEEAYQIIQEMLDKRSRKGLPTFFISRYSLDTLGAMDKTGNYQYIKDWNDCENSLKYPVIVEFRQRK